MTDGLGLDLVRTALTEARARGFAEVDLRVGEDRFRARLAGGSGPAPAPEPEAASGGPAEIRATAVGIFRAAAGFGPGFRVAKGTPVGAIEALGISTDLESRVEGTVEEALVEDGEAVEYGRVIARVGAA